MGEGRSKEVFFRGILGEVMISSFVRAAAAATASLTLWGAASAANATIYNISAQNSGIDITLAEGDYLVSWVGIAGGGLYDAWNINCPTGNCVGGWSNAFSSRDPVLPADGNFDVDVYGNGPFQASALASLQAIQSAATIAHVEIGFTNFSVTSSTPLPAIAQPWIVHLGGDTFHLSAGDGSPADNFGGVSLSITAVPEPASWMTMIGGFGLAGAALRRRRAGARLIEG